MHFDIAQALIRAMNDAGLTRLSYTEGDFHLELEKAPSSAAYPAVTEAPALKNAPDAPMPVLFPAPEANTPPAETEGYRVVSPIVGTFYAAAGPDAAPFASVGQRVRKGEVLCIVEAMKTMNEIECERDGVVCEVLVENGMLVEYGQPLFLLEV